MFFRPAGGICSVFFRVPPKSCEVGGQYGLYERGRLHLARKVSTHPILHVGFFAEPDRSETLYLSLSIQLARDTTHLSRTCRLMFLGPEDIHLTGITPDNDYIRTFRDRAEAIKLEKHLPDTPVSKTVFFTIFDVS